MRNINRVAVLGSGVMGATIAAHLVNAGLDVILLDIVPKDADENNKNDRNRLINAALKNLAKMKPAPAYLKANIQKIQVGNFEDDIKELGKVDWAIEVIIENMEIKKRFFGEKVVPNLAKGALLTTNTSGLSVNEMADFLPEDIRKNFLVTHFFNPPRYMRLMEVIPSKYTDPEVVELLSRVMSKQLGKVNVYAKDTPNFIANRIGVYSICNAIVHMRELEMSVEEVDVVAGPATGRASSACFRTADLVGLDTLAHVAQNSYDLLPHDEKRDTFLLPDFLMKMIEKGQLGNKTKQGFYKKDFVDGKKQISYFDYVGGEYKPVEKPKFASIAAGKQIDDLAKRLQALMMGKDKAAELAWRNIRDTLIYSFNRIPEIADDVVNIDNGMKFGFAWDMGPFEMFDAIGVKSIVKRMEKEGSFVPEGLKEIDSFYRFENGKEQYYDVVAKEYKDMPFDPEKINLTILKKGDGTIEKKTNYSLVDLGDGVWNLEFHSKMNSLTGDIVAAVPKILKRVEDEATGLVLSNHGKNFSVGANIMMLGVAIAEGAYEDVDLAIKSFQKASMAIKYSKVPVVAAPHNMALGGGCEFCLHSDAINPHAETYMGLVEVGVGLLPGGGGTKEMALRAMKLAEQFDMDVTPFMFKYFQQIGTAQVGMSADELYKMGYLRQGDKITMNLDYLISDAKKKVISLAANYRPSQPEQNLKAAGRSVAASIKSQLWNMSVNGFATEYEAYMGGVIADAMTGGDVPAGTIITEEYMLAIEREGFLKLCGNAKTAQRIQHMLKTGKPLRN